MAEVYGHRPPPALTKNEEALIGVMTFDYVAVAELKDLLPYINQSSMSVALVRLQNRGLVESVKQDRAVVLKGKPNRWGVRLWKRVE